MKSRASVYILLLTFYILLQFVWWGYLLVSGQPNRIYMILGEGAVFLGMLLFGIYRLYKSIQKEFSLGQRQNNFLLSVTHELKTPISSVQLILQTLLKRSFTEDQFQSFMQTALNENKKSEKLIESLLLAARIESASEKPVLKSVSINALLIDIIALYRIKSENIQFLLHGEEEVRADLDPSMIESAVINLIDNSIKYDATEIKLTLSTGKNYTAIEIADNGRGVDDNDAPFIFNKFYRSGDENIREKPGTGLGLFLTKELVSLNKGKISFQKNTPKGARFIIRFER